jgi:hypothetical protein
MVTYRTTALHVFSLVAARWLVTTLAGSLGFKALSDDDFARVTLAQAFSASPGLDPTGSSWLPFPFWVTGAAMAVFGTSLTTAKLTSLLIACASGILLYAAARGSRVQPSAAWLGAMLWTFVPVGVFTGAATVPELPTAALCASALLLLRSPHPHAGILAAALLIPATLSRYEAWPVALCVIISIGIPTSHPKESTKPNPSVRIRLLAIALAALGPLAWIAWNQASHGDPFHFHARVSSYWFAWGGNTSGWWNALAVYPKSVVLDAPVLTASLAGALYWNRSPDHAKTWLRPALAGFAVVAALTLAQTTGGAPTHHPERALLFLWAIGWIAVADLLAGHTAPKGPGWNLWRTLWSWAAVSFLLLRTYVLAPDYGLDRNPELALGTWLRQHTEGPILFAPKDYGYFAVMAALRDGDRLLLASSVDPRDRGASSPFLDGGRLLYRIRKDRVGWLVASGNQSQIARNVGEVRIELGDWTVVQVPASTWEPARSGSGAGR